MYARRTVVPGGDAGPVQQPGECRLDGAEEGTGSGGGQEETGGGRTGEQLVAPLPVVAQHRRGGRVQRYQPGAVVFAGDGDDAGVQVDIGDVQGERLADAHATYRQKTDEGVVGGRLNGNRQCAGRVDERADLLRRIQVGRG